MAKVSTVVWCGFVEAATEVRLQRWFCVWRSSLRFFFSHSNKCLLSVNAFCPDLPENIINAKQFSCFNSTYAETWLRLMLGNIRSVVSVSGGKSSINEAEMCPNLIFCFCWRFQKNIKTHATYFAPVAQEDVGRSVLNEACLHCFCLVCVFQLPHALISAWLVFLVLHLEGFWLEYYLLERCGLSKLKQVNGKKSTAQSCSINTSRVELCWESNWSHFASIRIPKQAGH